MMSTETFFHRFAPFNLTFPAMMPSLRRRPTRPTQAVAFSVATAPQLVPPPEADILNQFFEPPLLNLLDISDALSRLSIPEYSFAEAIFHIAQIQPPKQVVPRPDFIRVYAVLRRLASVHPSETIAFRQAAEDAVWICFIAASGTPSASTVSLEKWERLMNHLGNALGGNDSLPSPDTARRFHTAWGHAQMLPKFRLSHSVVNFSRLLVVLRSFDAGLIAVLRSIGIIWTDAVRRMATSKLEPITLCQTNIEHHATFLSQFIEHSLYKIAQRGEEPLRAHASISSTGETERKKSGNTDVGSDSSVSEGDVSREWRSGNDLSEDVLDLPSISKVIRTSQDGFPLNLCEKKDSAPESSTSLVRRRRNGRGGRTPFHIDYDSLRFDEKIGEGAFGQVYKGSFLLSPVAVKVFHVNLHVSLQDEQRGENDNTTSLERMNTMAAIRRFASTTSQAKYRDFVREVEMMSVVRHPNLVLYMGACGDPSTPLCIVSELFTGGSLHEYLHTDRSFCPTTLTGVSFLLNIARGMFYLHSSEPSILHRDLKARNVLLSGRRGADGTPHVVICDFGFCRLFGEDCHSGSERMGTAVYMSPEVINGKAFEAADDVYSYGILMHEILTGCLPYEGLRAMQVVCQVVTHGMRPSSKRDGDIDKRLWNIMRACWDSDRKRRPTFDWIIEKLEVFARSMEMGKELL